MEWIAIFSKRAIVTLSKQSAITRITATKIILCAPLATILRNYIRHRSLSSQLTGDPDIDRADANRSRARSSASQSVPAGRGARARQVAARPSSRRLMRRRAASHHRSFITRCDCRADLHAHAPGCAGGMDAGLAMWNSLLHPTGRGGTRSHSLERKTEQPCPIAQWIAVHADGNGRVGLLVVIAEATRCHCSEDIKSC
jgi:hypothetical protein